MRGRGATLVGIAFGVAGTLCGPAAGVLAAGQTYETPGSRDRQQRGAAEIQRERQERAADIHRKLAELEADVKADREVLDNTMRQQREELEAKARQRKADLELKAQEEKARAATDEERNTIEARLTQQKAEVDARLDQQRQDLEAKTREERVKLESRLQEGQRDLKAKMEGVKQQADEKKADLESKAQQPEARAPQLPPPQASARSMSGMIASINADAGLLSIKEDMPSATQVISPASVPTQLVLERDVTVMQGDRKLALRDLRVGDRVTAQFDAGGSRTVHMIMLNEDAPRG